MAELNERTIERCKSVKYTTRFLQAVEKIRKYTTINQSRHRDDVSSCNQYNVKVGTKGNGRLWGTGPGPGPVLVWGLQRRQRHDDQRHLMFNTEERKKKLFGGGSVDWTSCSSDRTTGLMKSRQPDRTSLVFVCGLVVYLFSLAS